MHLTATSAEKNINYAIDYQCPQCGAQASLDEDARIFSCRFCRVRSLITASPFFRYALPSNAPRDRDLIYFPYWRFKGMVFVCSTSGISERFADVSLQAVGSRFFPVSVGLRSQTQSLRVLTPDLAGTFLKPIIPLKTVTDQLARRFVRDHTEAVAHEAVIGETISLIYSPFYMKDILMDGLTNTPADQGTGPAPDLPDLAREPVRTGIRFIPALCPGCGWDLDANHDALVLLCPRCETLWQASNRELKPVNSAILSREGPADIYLPFWRIHADITGLTLNTLADLAAVANLPMVVRKTWDSTRFHFWCPAFKLRPKTFLQTASRITLSQWRLPLERRFPKGRLFSVNLPLGQAVKSLVLILADVMRPKTGMTSVLEKIHTVPRGSVLAWLPFRETGHEYVQDRLNLAINRTMAGLAADR
ncbi:MAG: hypothetical protein V1793_17710 [Pseudomonadota bacterium]